MIPELAHFALILTLFVALAQGVLALRGAAQDRADWIAIARPAAQIQFLLGSEQLLLARRRRAIVAGPPPVQWREGGEE